MASSAVLFLIVAVSFLAPNLANPQQTTQKIFATAREAVDVLIATNRNNDIATLNHILGPDASSFPKWIWALPLLALLLLTSGAIRLNKDDLRPGLNELQMWFGQAGSRPLAELFQKFPGRPQITCFGGFPRTLRTHLLVSGQSIAHSY